MIDSPNHSPEKQKTILILSILIDLAFLNMYMSVMFGNGKVEGERFQ